MSSDSWTNRCLFIMKLASHFQDTFPSIFFLKLLQKIVDFHLTKVINQDIELNGFSEFAEVASVRSLYKR